jgi:hypothetical protein
MTMAIPMVHGTTISDTEPSAGEPVRALDRRLDPDEHRSTIGVPRKRRLGATRRHPMARVVVQCTNR